MSPATADRCDPALLLAERVVRAVAQLTGVELTPEEALVREAAPEHGVDYQSNVAMSLAKRLGRPPRELADELARALDVADLCEDPSVAGPGFINLRLRERWLAARLGQLAGDERLGVPPDDAPRRVVVDYSAPNVAKEMHVGHLRSTIIGDALVRMLRFCGHEVIAQNHIGDWGTPFGMLIEHMLDDGGSDAAGGDAGDGDAGGGDSGKGAFGQSLADLGAFYQAAHAKFSADPAFAERARRRVVDLQSGEPRTLALWRRLVDASRLHFNVVYDLLGVALRDEDIAGESTYADALPALASELQDAGLAVVSDGALCVFPAGFRGRDGEPVPLIVRKSDGGYSYDATDLAALRHRVRDLGANELLYVVGAPQRLHFEMVFQVAREAGWLDGADARHIAFGSVLGDDRKMLRTRSGEPVRLIELLDEAIERAARILAERGMEPDRALARAIGIGAVKYADLASDREKDYVFSWERMLSFEGNTSVYLQYANARARSVLRRGAEAGLAPAGAGAAVLLGEAAERDLAVALARFPAAIAATLADYRPHRLCGYLHGLAVAYSAFYERCPVLTAAEPARSSRLLLCELTSRAITVGLAMLGIEAPERLSPNPARVADARML